MKIDIIILAPIREEYRAIRQHLVNIKPYMKQGFNCEIGTFSGKNKTLKVVLVQKGKGLVDIALATERAINHFPAKYIFLVGTAGGIKKVAIGDVVIGTKGYNYEAGRALHKEFRPTPKIRESDQELLELAHLVSQKKNWLQRINNDSIPDSIKVIAGPIASGEKVVETNQSIIISTIKRHYQDTIALEMEAYGFLEAAFKHKKVQALIIRSISDLLIDKTKANQQGSRELAATHAAAFAFEVIDNLPVKRKRYGIWLLGIISILFLLSGKTVYNQFNISIQQETTVEGTKIIPLDTLDTGDSVPNTSVVEKPSKAIPKRLQRTFTLNKILDASQIEQLEKRLQSKRVFSDESFKIAFTHTGQFINNPSNEHLFYYSGGQLAITINGNPCCCTTDKTFSIAATSFPGNRRAAEEKRVQKIQASIINKNFDSIVQTLETCLN